MLGQTLPGTVVSVERILWLPVSIVNCFFIFRVCSHLASLAHLMGRQQHQAGQLEESLVGPTFQVERLFQWRSSLTSRTLTGLLVLLESFKPLTLMAAPGGT